MGPEQPAEVATLASPTIPGQLEANIAAVGELRDVVNEIRAVRSGQQSLPAGGIEELEQKLAELIDTHREALSDSHATVGHAVGRALFDLDVLYFGPPHTEITDPTLPQMQVASRDFFGKLEAAINQLVQEIDGSDVESGLGRELWDLAADNSEVLYHAELVCPDADLDTVVSHPGYTTGDVARVVRTRKLVGEVEKSEVFNEAYQAVRLVESDTRDNRAAVRQMVTILSRLGYSDDPRTPMFSDRIAEIDVGSLLKELDIPDEIDDSMLSLEVLSLQATIRAQNDTKTRLEAAAKNVLSLAGRHVSQRLRFFPLTRAASSRANLESRVNDLAKERQEKSWTVFLRCREVLNQRYRATVRDQILDVRPRSNNRPQIHGAEGRVIDAQLQPELHKLLIDKKGEHLTGCLASFKALDQVRSAVHLAADVSRGLSNLSGLVTGTRTLLPFEHAMHRTAGELKELLLPSKEPVVGIETRIQGLKKALAGQIVEYASLMVLRADTSNRFFSSYLEATQEELATKVSQEFREGEDALLWERAAQALFAVENTILGEFARGIAVSASNVQTNTLELFWSFYPQKYGLGGVAQATTAWIAGGPDLESVIPGVVLKQLPRPDFTDETAELVSIPSDGRQFSCVIPISAELAEGIESGALPLSVLLESHAGLITETINQRLKAAGRPGFVEVQVAGQVQTVEVREQPAA